MGESGDDPEPTRLRERGASDPPEEAAWYDGPTAAPRPWERALRETETLSIREYLRVAREEGATTRALVLVAAALSLLVVVPAALVAGILTLFAFSFVERPLLAWLVLTAVVLAALVGWLETR